ncbi:MAG TPA: outer membrane protein assembly factor BamA [Myxococcota bacterium]|nr:outer membrane protein assembly factor BamA [Myxococcota bacterium]
MGALSRAGRGARHLRLRRVLSGILIGLALAAPSAAAAQAPAAANAPAAPAEPKARIAVLPFTVYSARDQGSLGEELAGDVRARLETFGSLRVLDAASSSGAATRVAQGDEAALREAARQLGVDFVVSGTLTELAGRYNLDVRVTSAEPGQPGLTQVRTAASPEELGTRIPRIAEAIVEHAVGAAPALVTKVEIVGAAGFEQELLAQLGTRPGLPYDAGRMRADLANLRANPAVVSAEVATNRVEQGIEVRFDIVLADPSLRAPAVGQGEVIADVIVRGNRRIEADAIKARIASKPGQRFDPAQVSRDIAEVQALGFFRSVRVFSDATEQGRVLIFEVEENPVVRQISITGNDNIEGDKIRDALTLTTGSTLDYPLLYENRERVVGIYRAEGYYLAEVNFEIEPIGEASVGINFDVHEGEKLKLREIDFEGNEHFSSSELREGFQTRVWHFWSYATSWFDRSGTYSEPLFLQDLRGVERKYTDAGYLQVNLHEPEVVPSKDGLRVTVAVDEGRRFRVGTIDISGDPTANREELRETLKLEEGEIFNRSHLTEDIATLTAHYQDRGFYFAQVTPLSNLSETSEVVDVRFDVKKGPLYFVRRVEIAGNTTTVDPVIRREIPIVEGELYSQRKIMIARTRVERLGFFEEVDFKMQPTEQEDQLDLQVNIVERPTGSFSFGAGYSSQDGLVLQGSLSQTNLFGRGYAANISADLGGSTQRYFVNLQDPSFLGSTFSLGTTISRTTLNYEDFEQQQTGADLVLGHALTEDNRSRGFLRYSFSQRSLDDNSNVDAAAVIFREILQNDVTTSLLGISMVRDSRDDRFAPISGERIGLSLEGAGIGGFSQFLRAEARASWFLGAPRWLLPHSTFVANFRTGWAVPFNQIGDFESVSVEANAFTNENVKPLDEIDDDITLPLTERYFLGGLGNFGLRGFKARSVGPRRAILRQSADGTFAPTGVNPATGECQNNVQGNFGGNGSGKCNSLKDKDIDDFDDLDETDVIGGNKFITTSFEYRFPISETIGLQGVAFMDMGNAFDETDYNMVDVTNWRYGTGGGVQWFSPFGPLAVVLGFPLDPLSVEDSPVFEFSVGGVGF